MANFIAPVTIGFKIAKTVSKTASSYKELTGNETPEEAQAIQDYNSAITVIAGVKIAAAIANTTLSIVQVVHNYNVKTTRFGHLGQDQIDQDSYQDHIYQNTINIWKGGISGAAGGAVTGAAIGSIVPGLGTAAGAIVGALMGTALGALGSYLNNSINDSLTLSIQNQQYAFNNFRSMQQSQVMQARIGRANWNDSRY